MLAVMTSPLTQTNSRHPQAEPFWLPGGPVGVLLVHGYGGSIGDLRELAEELHRAGYSVRGVSLAGHGLTETDLAATHPADWRESVFLAARELKRDCRQVLLLGTSFGGALALDYALHAPDKIRAVVTVNTALDYRGLGPMQKLFLRLLRLFTPYFRKPGLTPSDRERMRAIGSLDRWAIDGIFETADFVKNFVWPSLPRLLVPVLVIGSDQDPYVDPASADRLLKRIGSQTKNVVRLETSTHRPLRDPKLRTEVMRQVQTFLKPLA